MGVANGLVTQGVIGDYISRVETWLPVFSTAATSPREIHLAFKLVSNLVCNMR
jgi:hypothetical protein